MWGRGLSDSELLLVLIGAFFLIEGIRAARRRTTVFITAWGRDFAARAEEQLFEFGDRRLAFLPLVPSATAAACSDWPALLTPTGIIRPAAEAGQDDQLIPYESVQETSVQEASLQINGEPFLKARSARWAQLHKEQIDRLRQVAAPDRPAAIREFLRHWNDLAAIKQRADDLHRESTALRRRTWNLYLLSFVFGPALLYVVPVSQERVMLLAVYLTAFFYYWPMSIRAYFVAHRTLFPDLSGERKRHGAYMLLSPGIALRGFGALGERIFEEFSPIAVACGVCPPASARSAARRYLLELQHTSFEDAADPAVRTAWTWLRDEILVVSAEPLDSMGWSAADLVRFPEPEVDARTYCPRCDRQFRLESGECHACHIPLIAFPQGSPGFPSN